MTFSDFFITVFYQIMLQSKSSVVVSPFIQSNYDPFGTTIHKDFTPDPVISLEPPKNFTKQTKTALLRRSKNQVTETKPSCASKINKNQGQIKSLQPIQKSYKDTKNNLLLSKTIQAKKDAELENKRKLEKLQSKNSKHVLVPTWAANEFNYEELMKQSAKIQSSNNLNENEIDKELWQSENHSPKKVLKQNKSISKNNKNGNDKAKSEEPKIPMLISETSAYKQAEFESARHQQLKKLHNSNQKNFDRKLKARVKSRSKAESLILDSLSADITNTKENVYLQFMATVTKENDLSNRSEKRDREGGSKSFIRGGGISECSNFVC